MASAANNLFTLGAPSNLAGVSGTFDVESHGKDCCDDDHHDTKKPSIFDVVKAGLVFME
jgi:hypothetical protein